MVLLHAVTPNLPDIPDDNLIETIMAIMPFVDFIQLREKSRSAKSLALLIERMLAQGVDKEKLIVNDRADIAHVFKIPRTHLTEKSLSLELLQSAFPEMKFGRSVHSVSAVEHNIAAYDYLYLGHIFPTSKKSYPALGIESLAEAYRIAKGKEGRLIAIGGMNAETVPKVLSLASGIAVMSAFFPIINHRLDSSVAQERAHYIRKMVASP